MLSIMSYSAQIFATEIIAGESTKTANLNMAGGTVAMRSAPRNHAPTATILCEV
jgi:hypothetical protein